MKLISLDPSSTCVGYAVFVDGVVIDGGLLKPKSSATDAISRVRQLCMDAMALLDEMQPDRVLIEVPTGKQYSRKPGRVSALPVWAFAAGAMWELAASWCRVHPPAACVAISNEWTRGSSKEARRDVAATFLKDYDPKKDRGMDLSDAVMMGKWWLSKGETNG